MFKAIALDQCVYTIHSFSYVQFLSIDNIKKNKQKTEEENVIYIYIYIRIHFENKFIKLSKLNAYCLSVNVYFLHVLARVILPDSRRVRIFCQSYQTIHGEIGLQSYRSYSAFISHKSELAKHARVERGSAFRSPGTCHSERNAQTHFESVESREFQSAYLEQTGRETCIYIYI